MIVVCVEFEIEPSQIDVFWQQCAQTQSSHLTKRWDANNLMFVRTETLPVLYFCTKFMTMRWCLKHTNLHRIIVRLIQLLVAWS